ncbi:MAG TPA: hypothetical protein VHS59_04790 [Bacillota bacterium]|nr:hypothetical protein [Bacillota bacterium]
MTTKFDFLKDLEQFIHYEGNLEQKKAPTRPAHNFSRLMAQLKSERMDKVTNYQERLNHSRKRVEKLRLYHNTGLDELVGILKAGRILSPKQLEEQNISFSLRTTPFGASFHLEQYVFAHCRQANWLYGLYQLRLKPEVEELPGALFLPGEDFAPEEQRFKEHIMPLSHWRDFLAEQITVRKVNSANYSQKTPSTQFPEFLFIDNIPLSMVEAITCPTPKIRERLYSTVAYELNSTSVLKEIPVEIYSPEVLQWTNFR